LPSNVSARVGNIAPYRKALLLKLAQNWRPQKNTANLVVLLTIAKDGSLLGSEIFQSSGNRKADREALAACQAVEYEPLPDWYKGEQLQFKIELSKVEALQQE
jgi:TonB family protein